MRTMKWEEVNNDWGGLQKRHRMEIAQAVARYCIGHTMGEVAKALERTESWVRDNLDCAAIGATVGEGRTALPYDGVRVAERKLLKEYGPTDAEQQSEEFEPYVEHYQEQGHGEAASKRLAKAEWAAEAAIEGGVIQESTNRRNENVNQILFPNDQKDSFDIDLRMHMTRVASAAKFLDDAKINFLRRKATCDRVTVANEKWLEQVERVLNFHPTLSEGK